MKKFRSVILCSMLLTLAVVTMPLVAGTVTCNNKKVDGGVTYSESWVCTGDSCAVCIYGTWTSNGSGGWYLSGAGCTS